MNITHTYGKKYCRCKWIYDERVYFHPVHCCLLRILYFLQGSKLALTLILDYSLFLLFYLTTIISLYFQSIHNILLSLTISFSVNIKIKEENCIYQLFICNQPFTWWYSAVRNKSKISIYKYYRGNWVREFALLFLRILMSLKLILNIYMYFLL